MRFFDEETLGKGSKETLVLMTFEEASIVLEAMCEYVKVNKRKTKAKKLYNDMFSKLSIGD